MASFEFKQSVSIDKSTGKKAGNLLQLREVIAQASEESIIHHTHRYFLKGHMLEYTNDFAEWTGESLGERALAEHLSNIDPYDYKEIGTLRNELVDAVDGYLDQFPNPKDALPGDEFYLGETVTFIFPMGIRARNLAEFLTAIKYIEERCIYYHFYEARIRLAGGIDDFSRWFEDALGEKDIAAKIRTIDPLMYTTEQIRTLIAGVVEEEVRRNMEVIQ